MVTDSGIPNELANEFTASGIKVHIAAEKS